MKGKEVGVEKDNESLYIWNLLTYDCHNIIKNINCCRRNSIVEIENNRMTNCIIKQLIENNELGLLLLLLEMEIFFMNVVKGNLFS